MEAVFSLTSAKDGVQSDIAGNRKSVQIVWTASEADNAFLVLPKSEGLIHNGKELFGNFTAQPPAIHPKGFAALAVYDQSTNG